MIVSFCLYRWNWWPSLFEHFFLKWVIYKSIEDTYINFIYYIFLFQLLSIQNDLKFIIKEQPVTGSKHICTNLQRINRAKLCLFIICSTGWLTYMVSVKMETNSLVILLKHVMSLIAWNIIMNIQISLSRTTGDREKNSSYL